MAEIGYAEAHKDREFARAQAGAALRRERERKGLSLREVARQLGVSAPFLSDVELGRRWLSLRSIRRNISQSSNMPNDTTKPDTQKHPLGGPAWLFSIASEKEEMLHALGSIDDTTAKEEAREIQGLKDAANRMRRLEIALDDLVKSCLPQGKQLALLGVKAPSRAVLARARSVLNS